MPASVVTVRPATVESGATQDLTGLPSTITKQALHWALPQPNLLPLMSKSFAKTFSSGVVCGAVLRTVWPLSEN
jgi:hypothetical protein